MCSWRCGVDRTRGPAPLCGSGATARLTRTLDSDGDEPELGRQFVAWLAGCNWACPFCQWPAELDPRAGRIVRPRELAAAIDAAGDRGCGTVHIVGGNPDQHAPTVLRVLRYLRRPLHLAWDANASATGVLLGLVPADWWILDLRAGNERCAQDLGGAPGAWAATRRAILTAARQPDARTIVRHLVLPGHLECCTKPVIAWLADASRAGCRFRLNVQAGYVPRHRAIRMPGLDRRLSQAERDEARALARSAGIPLSREVE